MRKFNPYVQLISAGFRYGRPDCNHIFDVSWLTDTLGEEAQMIVQKIADYAEFINSKDRAVIGICCVSGTDSSPQIARQISNLLNSRGIETIVSHRDLNK